MKGKIKKSKAERIGLYLIYVIMLVVIFITLYPFIYVFSMSVSDPMSVLKQEVWFLPKGFNLDSIKRYLKIRNYGCIMEIPSGIR